MQPAKFLRYIFEIDSDKSTPMSLVLLLGAAGAALTASSCPVARRQLQSSRRCTLADSTQLRACLPSRHLRFLLGGRRSFALCTCRKTHPQQICPALHIYFQTTVPVAAYHKERATKPQVAPIPAQAIKLFCTTRYGLQCCSTRPAGFTWAIDAEPRGSSSSIHSKTSSRGTPPSSCSITLLVCCAGIGGTCMQAYIIRRQTSSMHSKLVAFCF